MTEREKKRARLRILLDASILYRDVSNIKEKETAFNKYIRKRGITEKFYFSEVRDIWKVKKEEE